MILVTSIFSTFFICFKNFTDEIDKSKLNSPLVNYLQNVVRIIFINNFLCGYISHRMTESRESPLSLTTFIQSNKQIINQSSIVVPKPIYTSDEMFV